MGRRWQRLIGGAIASACLLLALSMASPLPAGELSWQAEHDRDHPLLGEWLDRRSVPMAPLDAGSLGEIDVLFLGETHGHPDHHALQLELLRVMQQSRGGLRVGFEIFDLADQPRLDALRAQGVTDAEQLGEELGMADRPWPWDKYLPLVAYALEQDLPIVALNLSSEQVRAVIEEGVEALPADSRMRAHLKAPERFSEEALLEWRDDMIDAHCGHLPAEAARAMLAGQQARDAVMAERLADMEPPMVAILGSEHARLDRGVPVWLRLLRPDWRLMSVGLSQVDPERADPADYAERATHFDAIWLAPRQYRESACERFREQLERMREARGEAGPTVD